MQSAKVITCVGTYAEHGQSDGCLNCAPWWYFVPTCDQGHKLRPSGPSRKNKGYCSRCQKYYTLADTAAA